ncbi:MAG: pyridoxamine 5'-phosphate oxidase, partial [Chitinophagaceae bacterium]
MNERIASLRLEYSQKSLLEEDVAADAIEQFDRWWQEALNAEIIEVNAMTLATASADGMPSARIVLLKDFSKEGFVFFTNYNSYKGRQLAENPKACLVFFWKELERQVRITGVVKKIAHELSDRYFFSRPYESQLSAHASPQSEVIESRDWLYQNFKNLSSKFETIKISRPTYWGG